VVTEVRPWDWTIRGLAFHGKTIQPTPVLQGGFMEVAVNPLLGLVDWSGGMPTSLSRDVMFYPRRDVMFYPRRDAKFCPKTLAC
jgi:hypothetical protein